MRKACQNVRPTSKSVPSRQLELVRNWSPTGARTGPQEDFALRKHHRAPVKLFINCHMHLGNCYRSQNGVTALMDDLFFCAPVGDQFVRNGKRSPRWDTFRGGPHILFGFSRKDIVTTNSCKTTGPNSAAVPNYSSSKCYGYLYIYNRMQQ